MLAFLASLSPEERRCKERSSAIFVQKWVRGHIARKSYRKQKQVNFKQMRKFRRMLSVAYGKLRTRRIKQIINVLRESGNLFMDQNYQLW